MSNDYLTWLGKFWPGVLSQPEFSDLNGNYNSSSQTGQNSMIKETS